MSSALDLVVLNGPHESEVVQLSPNDPLRVGRSARGFQVVDPLVSLSHAEVTWEGDRYWIEDLGSATGTFVNDVRLTDKAVCLVPGMRIRFGETVVEVRPRPKSALLRVLGAVSALFLLVTAVDSVMRGIEVVYEPEILWFKPVKQAGGYPNKVIEVPRSFIRRTGVDHRGLQIEQVTDFDDNGIDELWLKWSDARELVTFADDGSWETISSIPMSCEERPQRLAEGLPAECYQDFSRVRSEVPEVCRGVAQGGFPDLDCAGITYRYEGETYGIAGIEGPVVWMPPTEEVDDPKRSSKRIKAKKRVPIEGPPEPYIFTLSQTERLAGFLSDRGVSEPIHYLICESAFDGLRPQVLTAKGEIKALDVGCIGDATLTGPSRAEDFGEVYPQMIAFTGTGYKALLDDLNVWMGGGEKLFLPGRSAKLLAKLSAPPKRRLGSVRTAFIGPEIPTDSVAGEAEFIDPRQLAVTEFAGESPPLSKAITLPSSGRYLIDGCGELEVQAKEWHCLRTKGCSKTSTFMQIRNVGCGKKSPWRKIPYDDRVHAYNDGTYKGRVKVNTVGQGQIDVLAVTFAYQVPEEE
jgi:hypothetical protein